MLKKTAELEKRLHPLFLTLDSHSTFKVGKMFDTYKSYTPGFLTVGALSVVGALILPAIILAKYCIVMIIVNN